MKNSRTKILAAIAAAKLFTMPFSAQAQEVPEQSVPTPVVKEMSYSMYIGFIQDKKKIADFYNLFLERRPAFKILSDGKMGWYAGQSRITKIMIGGETGWAIRIDGLTYSDAAYLYPMMTSFFSAPDIQRDYGEKGGVWLYFGGEQISSEKFFGISKPEPKLEKTTPAIPSMFGVQIGAFKVKANADKRLAFALSKIDSRFQIVYEDGFYKVRMMDITAAEAVATVDKARYLLGTKEADFVVNGVTTSYEERTIRNMAVRSR